MAKAIILTENNYPCGDAGAIRQHATAKIFKELGYAVTVLGYGKSTNNKLLDFDGVYYVSFRPNTDNKIIRALFRATVSWRMTRALKKSYRDADVILLADVHPKTFNKVSNLYKHSNNILIHDSVEWFSPEQFKNGEKSLSYKNRDRINTALITKRWRVIAISTFLEEHFSKICKTERIPVIMDVSNIEYNPKTSASNSKKVFSYVGSPGKKDYLKNIIEGFELLSVEIRENIIFNVVGVSYQQLIDTCEVSSKTLNELKGCINIFGRLSHDEAIKIVRESDYTLLLRDETLRYSKAGFPTKIVESLASGTPPICNFSSDLSMYLVDGKNSIIANGHSSHDVKNALERAIESTRDESLKMRINARHTAEKCFDYTKYFAQMLNLIKP